jgi:TPR repeat protein
LLDDNFKANAAGVLIVFDITRIQTVQALRRWFEVARGISEELQIIVVASKFDVFDEESHSHALACGREFALKHQLGFVATSAKQNIGVEESFHELTRLIIQRDAQFIPSKIRNLERVKPTKSDRFEEFYQRVEHASQLHQYIREFQSIESHFAVLDNFESARSYEQWSLLVRFYSMDEESLQSAKNLELVFVQGENVIESNAETTRSYEDWSVEWSAFKRTSIELEKGVVLCKQLPLLSLSNRAWRISGVFKKRDDSLQIELSHRIARILKNQIDNDFALKELAIAALSNPNAQLKLGKCYKNGIGVAKDENAAFEFFQRAAKRNLDAARSEIIKLSSEVAQFRESNGTLDLSLMDAMFCDQVLQRIDPPKIKRVVIEDSPMNELPPSFDRLRGIKTLEFSDSSIQFRDSLCALKLERLVIRGLRAVVMALPDIMQDATSIKIRSTSRCLFRCPMEPSLKSTMQRFSEQLARWLTLQSSGSLAISNQLCSGSR